MTQKVKKKYEINLKRPDWFKFKMNIIELYTFFVAFYIIHTSNVVI